MSSQLLLANFDRMSAAPDAIPRLRSFILDLAVRGKLVEQDPNDEPASALLKRIHAEKQRLVKEGKVRGQDPAPLIENAEQSFQVPIGWCWARLAALSRRIHYGFTASAKQSIKDVRLLRITDIQNNSVNWDSVPGCEISAADAEQYKLGEGDILIARTGGTIGKTFLVRQVPVAAVFASYLIRIQGSSELFDQYLKLFLESPVYWKQLDDGTRGGGQPNVNGQTLGRMMVSVPPPAEQRRIVAKVDELMSLCDRLEAAQAERENRRNRLAAACLHRLSNGVSEEDIRESAHFYLNHLPIAITRTEHVQQLRQSILDLAVRGRLVHQEPRDVPAADLLKHLQAEKERLIKKGTIPRQKPAPLKDAVELRFPRPQNWEGVRFGSVCNLITSGSRGWAEYYAESGPKFIRAQNIRFGRLRIDDLACVSLPKKTEGTRTQVSKDDLLIVITGAGVTNPALLEQDLGEAYVSQHVALIKPTDTNLSRWLLLCLMAPSGGRAELVKRAYGAGKPGLNLDNIRFLSIQLPPLAEQRRIVAKVDKLMTLCDQLEAQLNTAQEESRRLLEATLVGALSNGRRSIEMKIVDSPRATVEGALQ